MTISTISPHKQREPDDRLDQLVPLTNRSFSETRISLDMIEGKVDGLGERLDGVENRLKVVGDSQEKLEDRQEKILEIFRAAQEAGKL